MPARRRTARARCGLDPAVFVHGDGYRRGLLSGERLAPDRATAAQEWERVRGETWNHWLESRAATVGPCPYPPYAAVVYDNLTRGAADVPHGTASEVAEAVRIDLGSLAAFRRDRPAAAAQCEKGLAAYEADLFAIAATAERDALSTTERLGP